MKFKKLLTIILLGTAILSTGCSTEKNIPQETSQSNAEIAADSVGILTDQEIEEKENVIGFTLDFIQQPEEAKEIISRMEAEFNSRKRIDDTNLIKLIYDEIVTLEAEKISTEFATDFYDNILFGFDFVDNKDFGKEGNSQKEYIRYLAAMKNNLIFIPIVEEHGDHDHIYYATATITDELFNILEGMVFE